MIGDSCWVCRRSLEEVQKEFEEDITLDKFTEYKIPICSICQIVLGQVIGEEGFMLSMDADDMSGDVIKRIIKALKTA